MSDFTYREADAQRNILLRSDDEGVTWVADTTAGRSGGGGDVIVFKNSIYAAVRSALNLIEGDNITLTVTDDPTNNQVDVEIDASGGGTVAVQDETSLIVNTSTMNFEGAGVTVTESPAGTALITIPGGGGGSLTVTVDGAGGFTATTIDFLGADFDVTESPSGEANVSIDAAIARVADAVMDTDAAGGDLAGTYPNPTVAALAITDAKVATANKDGAAGTASMRTLGTGAAQATAGNDSRLSDARTPTSHATSHEPAGGDAMAVDAAAGTGSLRTIGTGALTAAAGNDARLSDSRAPNGAATGDLTGSYPAPTVAAGVITLAKMANLASKRLIGRDTAGTGVPEAILLNATLELDGSLNLQRAALTGDVTASAGSNATTIANDAVTYAKMQNVSATDRLLGRVTSGAGDPEEIPLATGLEFSGGSLRVPAFTGDVTKAAASNATTVTAVQGNTHTSGAPTFGHAYVWDNSTFKRAGVAQWAAGSGTTVNVNNTAAQTTLLPSTYSIAADTLKVGDFIELNWRGLFSNTTAASNGTFTFSLYAGTTQLVAVTTPTITFGAAQIFGAAIRTFAIVTATGGSGAIRASILEDRTTAFNTTWGAADFTTANPAVTVATNATQALDLRVQHSVANALFVTETRAYVILRTSAT